jgi:hypothetical protein
MMEYYSWFIPGDEIYFNFFDGLFVTNLDILAVTGYSGTPEPENKCSLELATLFKIECYHRDYIFNSSDLSSLQLEYIIKNYG